ncbi:hypothetical protein RhiirA4_432188 [Rhizophagus irregularis]|uniref:Uncharacterized protein n=1 Tax=Rhizophagus irregularis TaxID=588596 RepID=A0A2I1HSV0_9GLOM|nr:hypothetical protein RhiirA4_432188 [Rhizophagus irregularis]
MSSMENTNFVHEEDIIYEEDLNAAELNNMNISELEDDIEEIYFITKQMTVKTIIHSLTSIEYPPTSKEGVAIIYHVEGWNNVEEVFTDIQYSMGKPCGQHVSTCSYLGDVTVEKKDRTCQGVKLYEFANPELLEMNHDSINTDSDLQLKINKEIIYLAAFKTKCRYMQNGVQCTGKPILKCLKRKDNIANYFIGCSEWKFNEKFHRFINIKENVDLNLLRQLLDGLYEGESNEPTNDCFTVLHNSSKKTLCPHPHRAGNIIKQGAITQKTCGVKYFKIIPHDIKSCPYVILVSKGIHSHPPPPPSCVPLTIRSRLQELIHQANDNNVDATPTNIITGNLIKTYFGTDYLSEIHASLNNNDHLRYYVDKIQKEVHPHGQGLLGVVYNYSRNINNFCDYVKRLGKNKSFLYFFNIIISIF